MKKRFVGLAVVLVSLAAFGVGNAQIPFHGVIDPQRLTVQVDTAILTLPSAVDTVPTPGWSASGIVLDTFDFPDIAAWPFGVTLKGTIAGSPNTTNFLSPVADSWYPFLWPIEPAPKAMFYSMQGVGESRSAIEPLQRLKVSPSVVAGQMTIRLQPVGTSRPEVEIRDAAGNLIRALDCVAGASGLATATWNREDRFGRLVPEGVYFCQYPAAGAVRKVLVTH